MATGGAAVAGAHDGDTTARQAEDAWFDLHFAACATEYEAILRSVGLQPGWHVLDAGCGSGAYLPLLADLVGPRGRIAACDLAPDTVATIGQRVTTGIVTPVAAWVGSVTALPYADDTFDALWCANTSQYLADNELRAALEEFRRVVRPGGLVALKESDRALTHFPTAPPLLVAHLFEAMARGGGVQAVGNLRGASLAGRLRDAGMVEVRTHTVLVERGAPLDGVTRRYWDALLAHLAPTAMRQPIAVEERAVWEALLDTTERGRVLDDPACYCREGHVVLVGSVPS